MSLSITDAPIQAQYEVDGQALRQQADTQPAQVAQNPLRALQEARAAGAQAMPQADRASVAQHTREGFLDKISRWFSEGHQAFKDTYGLPPTTTIQVGGKDISYSRAELASMIKSLPRLERAEARENLVATLTARVDRGQNIANDVLSGAVAGNTPATRCTEQDAADIMLFLDAKNRATSATGASFANGSFSIEDPQGRLYEYLDRSEDKYIRSSSHMSSQQSTLITDSNRGTHSNMHRGIDFRQGPATGLPNGLQTVLFATIPANVETGASRRVFLKPESFGCCLNTLSTAEKQTGVGTGVGSVGRESRGWTDFKQFLGHAGSFIYTRFASAGETSRKERIPEQTKESFKALMDKPSFAVVRHVLEAGNPLSTSNGISKMITNINTAIQSLPLNERGAAIRDLIDFMNQLPNQLVSANHLDARIGNEVMFNLGELQSTIGNNDGAIIPAAHLQIRDAFTTTLNAAEQGTLQDVRDSHKMVISQMKSGMVDVLRTLLDANSAIMVEGARDRLEALYDRNGLQGDNRNPGMLVGNELANAFAGLPAEMDLAENRSALLNLAKQSFDPTHLASIDRLIR